MDNQIHIPLINPVKLYDVNRSVSAKYQTKQFDDFMFAERLYYWQSQELFKQIWQVDDIIYFHFIANFDVISATVVNRLGIPVLPAQPALIGLPDENNVGFFAFNLAFSLADIATTGCYKVRVTLGSSGPQQRILESDFMLVSTTPIPNSFLMEYWNSSYHEDVIFETGIKFQWRVFGNIGFLDPGRNEERYRTQKFSPVVLSSRTTRQWPMYFGDQFGLTDEHIDLLNRIWSCDNVLVDQKYYCPVDGSKFEFVTVEKYPKRGVKLIVEEGINRNSKIFALNTDTNKKLFTSVIVEASVFGDLANQGSMNTVPVINAVTF